MASSHAAKAEASVETSVEASLVCGKQAYINVVSKATEGETRHSQAQLNARKLTENRVSES